mmetsp:Transcript_26347/g.40596  ORF Transcript_26347/g.40596 Transcript_26347/m.40596 type:complete len:126 (-) Transcript_26347:226-603(-)
MLVQRLFFVSCLLFGIDADGTPLVACLPGQASVRSDDLAEDGPFGQRGRTLEASPSSLRESFLHHEWKHECRLESLCQVCRQAGFQALGPHLLRLHFCSANDHFFALKTHKKHWHDALLCVRMKL